MQLQKITTGFVFFALLNLASIAKANVCGSDLQNFNPTSSNLSFVTVQSSSTLEPCLLNMGVFFDYAINTLTYTKDLSNRTLEGSRVKNALLSGQLSFGMGITSRWDIGLNLPFLLSQELKDNIGTTAFAQAGLNEVRMNTKYRFYGEPSEGMAFVFSLGQNTIQNNPFSGRDSSPNAILELAADTRWSGGLSGAINVGYKRRLPGTPIPNQPFVPMKDQYLLSVAGGYLFGDLKSKLILELYSAIPASKVDQNTNKNLNSSEINLGLKRRYSRRSTFHVGVGSKIFDSFGAPDFRVYTGMTWFLGPVCNLDLDKKNPKYPYIESDAEPGAGDPLAPIQQPYDPIPFDEFEEPLPEPFETSSSPDRPDVYRFDVGVLFETDSAVVTKNYARLLSRMAKKFVDQGFRNIVIAGHTDSVGPDEYNKALSQRRADSVKRVLARSGHLSREQISLVTIEAWGEAQPIDTNDTPEGRQKNRRVDIQVWK